MKQCECINWCRADTEKPRTNHHYDCEHVDESLIDVWHITLDGCGDGFFTDCQMTVNEYGKYNDDGYVYEVVEKKMHKEIFDRLKEYGGF